MNYKVQLSPISTPPKPHAHLGCDIERTTLRLEDTRVFRSWLVYDSGLERSQTENALNWSAIGGLVIMAVVSAGGWYGFTVLLQHFLK
jgi:hypothetical protein